MGTISHLNVWQSSFVEKYLALTPRKTHLTAVPGSGKSTAIIFVANEMLRKRTSQFVITLSDRVDLVDQWLHHARRMDLHISKDDFRQDGTALTFQALQNADTVEKLMSVVRMRPSLIIVDAPHRSAASDALVSNQLLEANPANRAIFISNKLQDFSLESPFEYSFSADELKQQPTSEPKIALPRSPSFELISRLIDGGETLENLTWRAFEILISELLQADGYQVELMKGTKDGGVDVVATRDLGPAGVLKSLWQAKKFSKNKVGLSTIRELADTRLEQNANKAIVVTSTFLTRGALNRIERERFLLGKVDRNDLNQWLMRYAKGTWSPDLFGSSK
jgi:restriction endonuclease Mrr